MVKKKEKKAEIWSFKELGRKLKFRAKIGQKMSLKFNFKTDKMINSLKQLGLIF